MPLPSPLLEEDEEAVVNVVEEEEEDVMKEVGGDSVSFSILPVATTKLELLPLSRP